MSRLMRMRSGFPWMWMDRDLESLLSWPQWSGQSTVSAGTWFPLDLVETADGYRAVAEIPGVTRDQIEISLDANVLAIRVNKPMPEQREGDSVHLRERMFGEFTRSVALPKDIDPNAVEAELSDGLLVVTVGKREESKPRQIQIRTQ